MKENIELFGSFADPDQDRVALAQLGAAAVLSWDALPPDARDLLLGRTVSMSGIPTVGNARHRILDMVARNRPTTA